MVLFVSIYCGRVQLIFTSSRVDFNVLALGYEIWEERFKEGYSLSLSPWLGISGKACKFENSSHAEVTGKSFFVMC